MSLDILAALLHILYLGHITLGTILAFFTGAEEIPPTGFPHSPVLSFNPVNPYPTASTCAAELTLPTMYTEPSEFKRSLDVAFTCHGGFGLS